MHVQRTMFKDKNENETKCRMQGIGYKVQNTLGTHGFNLNLGKFRICTVALARETATMFEVHLYAWHANGQVGGWMDEVESIYYVSCRQAVSFSICVSIEAKRRDGSEGMNKGRINMRRCGE